MSRLIREGVVVVMMMIRVYTRLRCFYLLFFLIFPPETAGKF